MFAPTLRYHNGEFYVICTYLAPADERILIGTLFKTANPFDNEAWSQPVLFTIGGIDPDLFWDDDGKVYMAYAWINLRGSSPEGPHIYKKNDFHYLMIAEGGTELNHMETIARSRNVTGPYEAYEHNPILSNANTTEYFQTVGHADLFRDPQGKWWGVALSTRSGPAWEIYPMGRESVLYPVSWSGDWPVLDPVRGIMSGWPLPLSSKSLAAASAYTYEPDVIDFAPGSSLPLNFYTWRYAPRNDTFQVSPRGHSQSLMVLPSRANLTGSSTSPELSGLQGIAFVGRKQEHTLFTYAVDLAFNPEAAGQEAGVSAFLTQQQHLDLSLRYADVNASRDARELVLRFYAEGANMTSSEDVFALPSSWPSAGSVRLQIHTANSTHYVFSAWPVSNSNDRIVLGYGPAEVVSGGTGPFTGVILGVFATCNGGSGNENMCSGAGAEAYFSNWRYQGSAQHISSSELAPAAALHEEL
ncbi:Putative glycoside hydrolase, family 43, concanavalin A-like lectin/glucanase domain superfamily [Septoria linicola]|uniref:Glycoside hydrolase, family 43, concanavalin A-like lectin/glucanase domain superfamily n=1 Tax=Septoria linicola TaxID=215465 RepID=A0A9Q9EIH4_9PEZI|nr:putative glycoside hydrolase, family 43, concanavalin A-like lectin/glucanase domain superfamily [Septoria linicola]USW51047.1 Putative glycoside hydrolase, family 43, concanavalin A-like lectin/glucanase domain superfamily [Septoria linicola]